MSVLTLEEARSYARDYESTEEEMFGYIAFAEDYIKSAVGSGVDITSPRVKMLAGMLVVDVDENRGTSAAENNSRRYLVTSLITQLKAEFGNT